MSVIVIDTQIIVWSLLDLSRLSASARLSIDTASTVHASVASLYEIEYKRRVETKRGQRTLLHGLSTDLSGSFSALGLTLQDVTPSVAWRAASLDLDHGDPWDRVILATALNLGVPLISSDARLRQASDARVIW